MKDIKGAEKPQTCERCGETLKPERVVWLELSNTDGNYYKEVPTTHISQGMFPFGETCANKQMRDTIKNLKK